MTRLLPANLISIEFVRYTTSLRLFLPPLPPPNTRLGNPLYTVRYFLLDLQTPRLPSLISKHPPGISIPPPATPRHPLPPPAILPDFPGFSRIVKVSFQVSFQVE